MWFLMRLTKDEREINLANGEADPEFVEWKWELLSRAGFSSVDQFYASYPAGTELLTDTTKTLQASREIAIGLSCGKLFNAIYVCLFMCKHSFSNLLMISFVVWKIRFCFPVLHES
ncbi:uncharacterized protein LOC111282085 isoform X1 [Durio zibethinus]|uniref:Uncharacterized protein LOC111282085 isoform X1 n=1 Tax=Durio zibethinus TaxID=66656 RepID=A0A6P5XDN2_DURZI|nr:uncharacterized protein LOC111282085 isoform X1 [Durio zibethinus]